MRKDSMSDDRPIVYVEDGITTYRASALSICPRAFIYARQGHPSRVPKNLLEAFQYGTDHEDAVLEMAVRRGYNISHRQFEVLLHVSTTVRIVGHIDGYATTFKATPIPRSVMEVKCLNHENTEKFCTDPDSFPGYMLQAKSYIMGMEAEQVIFLIYDKDEDQLHEVKISRSELDAYELSLAIMDREQAWHYFQSEDVWPKCITTSFCPYYYLHEDELIDDEELERNFQVYSALQNQISHLEKLGAIVKGKIKDHLSEAAISKGKVGEFKFSYSEFTTRRLDVPRVSEFLKKDGRYDEFVKEVASTRLVVDKVDE